MDRTNLSVLITSTLACTHRTVQLGLSVAFPWLSISGLSPPHLGSLPQLLQLQRWQVFFREVLIPSHLCPRLNSDSDHSSTSLSHTNLRFNSQPPTWVEQKHTTEVPRTGSLLSGVPTSIPRFGRSEGWLVSFSDGDLTLTLPNLQTVYQTQVKLKVSSLARLSV